MKFIFWCEFPERVDWKKLTKWLDELGMDLNTYVACESRKQYNTWKKEITSLSKRIEVNAWPKLSRKDGYWFSGFVSKKNIDLLDDFKGIKIKIDVEPPIPARGYTFFSGAYWLLHGFFGKAKNRKYLQNKIKQLDKNGDIIASTFPFPKFVLSRFGWAEAKENNFMFYPSLVPMWLRWLYRFFYQFFILLNKDANFAIGLIGVGVFDNEPFYKNLSEFKTDLEFLKKRDVKKVLVFELSAITKRGKEWLEVLKDYS